MIEKLNFYKEAIEQEKRLKEISRKNKKNKNNKDQSNILGILSIVFGIICLFAFGFGFLFGIVGLICGIKGLDREQNTTVSKLGIIFSIISLFLSLLIFFGLISIASIF